MGSLTAHAHDLRNYLGLKGRQSPQRLSKLAKSLKRQLREGPPGGEGRHSRGWLCGSSIELVLELALGLGEGGAGDALLADVQLGVLLDVVTHDLLRRTESGQQRGSGPRLAGARRRRKEKPTTALTISLGSLSLPRRSWRRQGSDSLGTCEDLPEPPHWLLGETGRLLVAWSERRGKCGGERVRLLPTSYSFRCSRAL